MLNKTCSDALAIPKQCVVQYKHSKYYRFLTDEVQEIINIAHVMRQYRMRLNAENL